MSFKNIQFYSEKTPQLNEIVSCIPIKINNDEGNINFILSDYNNHSAMMTFNKATRKKRNVKWKKILRINKKTEAIVENVTKSRNNEKQIDLSFIDIDKNSNEYKAYIEIEKSNYQLKKIFKNISIKNNINLKELWENFVHKMDSKRLNENIEISLYEYVKININSITEYYNLNELQLQLIIKLFDNELKINKKIKTEFHIASLNGLDILKSTIDTALENYDQKLITVKRKKGTNYYIESNNYEITDEDHKNIINKIQENAKLNKIKFNLI